MPTRASKQSIYISIHDEGLKGRLSGRYNFHSLKDRAAAFIREGGKCEGLEDFYPYYLRFYTETLQGSVYRNWYLQGSERFEKNNTGGFLRLDSEGL